MSVQINDSPDHIPLLMRHPVRWIALTAICVSFLHHGITRFMDFDVAVSEMERVGMLPAAPIAAAVMVLQIICSIMILTGFWRWIGALALCAFTVSASVMALPFWSMRPGLDRLMASDSFMTNLGVAGGLLLIAWYDLHLWRTRSAD
jgi:uncharacterized membrane protein YphA (DoxX/SURF4 family)